LGAQHRRGIARTGLPHLKAHSYGPLGSLGVSPRSAPRCAVSAGSRPHDVIVVGAGIVGLAVGLELNLQHPALRVAVVEKERGIGAHQTGHNSGVVHRGIYYTPDSLKAQLCVAGATKLLAFCAQQGIPYQECGKLIVATNASEAAKLDELERRGRRNGVKGLELLGPERMMEIEPAIVGVRALYSPTTAILDFNLVARAYAERFIQLGGEIHLGAEVRSIRLADGLCTLETTRGELKTRHVVACAGLYSDRLARRSPTPGGRRPQIIPFRGDYYVLKPEKAAMLRGLVYPVPDPRFPFLGVHLTRRIDGAVWAGPNAALALAREGYGRFDLSVRDVSEMLGFGGFWRMTARYWRTGLAEVWRDYSKGAFLRAVRRFLPSLTQADLLPGPSGVRAQAVMADGSLVDDFVLDTSDRVIHVLNAPSPAATSALALARLIVGRANDAFDLWS
jgi:L-2-hydroxyglutarate oxidase